MDLIAQGQITENFIEPSFELVDTWNGYWNAIMPIGKSIRMAYPFPFMKRRVLAFDRQAGTLIFRTSLHPSLWSGCDRISVGPGWTIASLPF
jgi:hypothetical protein